MEIEYQQESLLEKTKRIMDSLLKAQGIEFPPENNSSPYQTQMNLYSKFTKQDTFSHYSSESTEEYDSRSQNDEQLSVVSRYSNNQPQKQCAFIPLYLELQNNENSFFIYGGMCLDFTFKIGEEDNILKKMNRQVNHVQYYKKEGLLMQYFGGSVQTIKDLNGLIRRAQSMNDYQYYQLSLAMMEYQKKIPMLLENSHQKAIKLQATQQMDRYEENYLKFQEWAISEVRKLDTNQLFTFAIVKYNLENLEMDIQISGQSQALMALRGIDLEDPYSYIRKDLFHYLDGESNLNLLINQMTVCSKDKRVVKMESPRMITFDRLKIQIENTCTMITNRDDLYPYKDEQMEESEFNFEFMLKVSNYTISDDTLSELLQIRKQRNLEENIQYEDFTYSMESQIFLEKFYNNQLQTIDKKKKKKTF